MRLGHRSELSDIAAGSRLSDVSVFFSMSDVLEMIEPLHKAIRDQDAKTLVNRGQHADNEGDAIIPEVDINCLRIGLFKRVSNWGGMPVELWQEAARIDVRCEHSIRLVQIREWDLTYDTDMLKQVADIYTDDEVRGNHG